jgi:nucleotide-binding universal stress UspA family protein
MESSSAGSNHIQIPCDWENFRQSQQLKEKHDIMKIICGTDFSIHAAGAVNVAAALAMRGSVPLKLVHAIESSRLEVPAKPETDYLCRKSRRRLIAEGNRLRTLGVDVTESLAVGKPHEILAASAKRWKARLIVISSLGRVSPIQWLAGSVAERTAQTALVPTLVVRDDEPLIAWAEGKRPLNVFVGYDFSASSDAALRWVASLQNIGPCNVTVTYLSWPPSETLRLGIGTDTSKGADPAEIEELLERDLKERCSAMLGKRKARLKVVSSWGNQHTHLIDLAKETGADLIVVGTNQRRGLKRFWLGSVSRGILNHAPMSVACVPRAVDPNEPKVNIPKFKRVLVPTDFSKLGNKAVAFAYGTAHRGGEVCLLHVISPVGGFNPDAERTDGHEAKRKQDLVARLQALVPKGVLARGAQSRVEVVAHRHPGTAICQAAERTGADLICIGSRGRSGLKKKLLGSVTESVMRRSKRPVLVIRN